MRGEGSQARGERRVGRRGEAAASGGEEEGKDNGRRKEAGGEELWRRQGEGEDDSAVPRPPLIDGLGGAAAPGWLPPNPVLLIHWLLEGKQENGAVTAPARHVRLWKCAFD